MFKWENKAGNTIIADGKALEYACFGPAPKEAPTIIMLHEGLGCLALWRDFPQKLADLTGFGVFAYSRAGYGQSDLADLPKSLDYMTDEAVDILPQILDAIGFQRGILLGHSDGASIAAIYAGSVEDHRIRGLILMAPHFFTEPIALTAIAEAKNAYETGDLRSRMQKYHRNPDNAFRGWNDSWLHPSFKDWNVANTIDYLRIPVLAIQGCDDEYGTYAQMQEIDDRIYAPVEIEFLDDCRHAPHFDQPEKTYRIIAGFIERLERIELKRVNTS